MWPTHTELLKVLPNTSMFVRKASNLAKFYLTDVIFRYFSTRGSSDMHDPYYDSYVRTTKLTDAIGHQYMSEHSPEYYMMIYPSGDFFRVFATPNPTFATAGAVVIIVFISVLFFLYDALVSKENQKNQVSVLSPVPVVCNCVTNADVSHPFIRLS